MTSLPFSLAPYKRTSLRGHNVQTCNRNSTMSRQSVTCHAGSASARKRPARSGPAGRERAVGARTARVEPTLGGRRGGGVERGAKLARRHSRPGRGQQLERQRGIAQDDATVLVDEQDPRNEGVDLRDRHRPIERGFERSEQSEKTRVGGGRPLERPTRLHKLARSRKVTAGIEVEDPARQARHGRAGGSDPNPRRGGAEAGRQQQWTHALALARGAAEEHVEAAGPAPRVSTIDVRRRLSEGDAPLLGEVIETVAPDAAALQPTVGGQPRHGRAYHPVIAAQRRKEAHERAEPYRPAARHDRIAED